ncbi:hypothetical protein BGZ76_002643 [Entomortierella beljakovae]|nr:hypothetical protein BGZ76_002643 [Entomortierella beljakovae]
MAHLTPLALHFTRPTPTNIDGFTSGCSDFFKINPPSKWLAEEYIKVDSTFDTYLATLERLGRKKTNTAVFCYKLHQHYLSSNGQEQLKLLKQQASTFLSKEIAKSSTHQAVYNEIHSDNDARAIIMGIYDRTQAKVDGVSKEQVGNDIEGYSDDSDGDIEDNALPKIMVPSKRSAQDDLVDENDGATTCPIYPHPRCIGSPSPLPTNLFPPVGSSKLPPPAYSPEGLQYAVLNQRTHWLTDDVDIGPLFKDYKQLRKASMDMAQDDIIDLTADSPFLDGLSDTAFNAVLVDFPTCEGVPDDLEELELLFGDTCSYEQLQDRVFNVAPNTPIRRFMFRILDSYSRYFPKHKDIPHLLERQAMFDLLCPFIRGALLVYNIESDLSEIAIIGSGVRKNIGKEASDKLSRCRLADITGNDGMGNQVFLAECSKIYEKDIRKFKEDRWKLARAMKDSWDSAVRKLAEDHRPHENLSVYGLHYFDEKLVFMKLDYRGHYRLWQIDSAPLPMRHHDFFDMSATCSKVALKFASAIAKEIGQRKKQPTISPIGVLSLSRAARSLKRTTNS